MRALILPLLVSASLSPARGGSCPPVLTQADAVLGMHVADRGLAGAALAVFDGAGTSYHERYFGSYDAGTFVPIASASKFVSATVILSLVDDGTLSLDDTVEAYLPQYAGTPNGAITLRQTFSQTSGLYNEEWPCIADGTTTLAACAEDILSNAPRVSPPGATFYYGGNSMHVAGRLAEIAFCNRFPGQCTGLGSGAVWLKIFQQRIKNPLGLAMTYNSVTNPRIGGGVVSRLSDYRKLWRMILNGGEVDGVRVLSSAAVEAMTRDQTRSAQVFYSAAQPDIRYGLAIWRFRPDSAGGAHVLSDPGKFGFHPWYDLDLGVLGIVMLSDPGGAAEGGGRHVAVQIERIVHDRLAAGNADTDSDGVCDAMDACPATLDPSQADADGDGAGDACDCAAADARVWAAPSETGRAIFYGPTTCLTVDYDPPTGEITCWSTRNLLDWDQPDAPGAIVTDLRYDVVRSPDLADFVGPAVCAATSIDRNGPFNDAYMVPSPPRGGRFGYLVRARNACGAGPPGYASNADPIDARACP